MKRRKLGTDSRSKLEVTPNPKKKNEDPSPLKHKLSKKKDDEADLRSPEDIEKKRKQQAGYFKFKSRSGPKNLGAKEVPVGAPNCLKNLTFVTTGVLDSFDREDIAEIIKKYGGRVTTSVSKKTSYLLVGDEAGESKLSKAKSLNIPRLTEDGFLELLRKSNPNQPTITPKDFFGASESDDDVEMVEVPKLEPKPVSGAPSRAPKKLETSVAVTVPWEPKQSSRAASTSPKKVLPLPVPVPKLLESKPSTSAASTSPKKLKPLPVAVSKPLELKPSTSAASKSPKKLNPLPVPVSKALELKQSTSAVSTSPKKVKPVLVPVLPKALEPQPSRSAASTDQNKVEPPAVAGTPTLMWVDKYKPDSLKNVIGQIGDKSNAAKLVKWLKTWFDYHGKADEKVKAAWPGLRDPEGKTFKAALLSGPPGIGKTTTAHLSVKAVGYDYFEMNASDTRNKKGLHGTVADSLDNRTMFSSGAHKSELTSKHVLIMDEVDGMSGNEDRGGIQELIVLIKKSRVPIICICNDRNLQKIRSLANYCFDLRFPKPTNEQLRALIQKLCYREKMKLPVESAQRLIASTDMDIRQIINQLELIKESSSDGGSLFNPKKDLKFGPWDVCRKVFVASEHVGKSINEKAGIFFQDYSFGPLFVQENYLRWTPCAAKGDKYKTMDLIKEAAGAIATGDLVDNLIRRSNNWSLLPTQSTFSSLLPGEYMEGDEFSGIEFPRWLGKNSSKGKVSRLLQQLHTHVHLEVSGSLEALNMDYLPYLRRSIVNPLVNGDVDEAAKVMETYSLLREDFDSINEIALWPGMKNPMDKVDTKTKSAFTRQVNKEILPYSIIKITKGRGRKGDGAEDEMEGLEEDDEGNEEEDEEDEEKVETDAMIKVRTSKKKTDPKESKKTDSKKESKVEPKKESKKTDSKKSATVGSSRKRR